MDKTTKELLEQLKQSSTYEEFAKENNPSFSKMKINNALNSIVSEKGLKKSEVIAKSCIEIHYAYQIFSGAKTPSRDKVLMLCIGMKLSYEEVNRLLRITGYAELYVKNERDNVLIFGLMKNIGVIEINSLLYELGLDLLV